MEIVMIGVEILRRAFCRCGPYLFVEIVMPGGTLLALLIYLYRRHTPTPSLPLVKGGGLGRGLSISPVVKRL
jgi:hypothetical protein